ncbi:MAG: TolC family protein [Ferruginibacter sp.]
MKHRLILLLAGVFALFSAGAQQSRSITLKEAIDLTLAYSKTLKTNKTKIEEAQAAVKEAYERKLPEASVNASYLFLPFQPNIDMKKSSEPGNGGSTEETPNVKQAMYGMANVSLPLYTGGRLNYGIESAKLLEQAIKLDADNDRELVILNVVNACINLYKAKTAIDLVKENLEQAQQRVKDFTNLEKNGVLARNDLMKAELQASNVELALLDAETNYKLACVNMNLMMGLPEQTELIPDKSGLALPTSIKTLDEYEQDAVQHRKDISALSFRKKAAVLGTQSARSNYYPSLALTGGYIAADIPKVLTITNAVNIGVGIKYDIASLWKTKTKIQQAKIKEQQLQLNEEALTDNIHLEVNKAYQNYLVSIKKIEVYKKSVEQATENYRITKNKYDNALATTTELLDADVALLQSKLSVTNAQADSFLAYNKLLQVAGSINN